MNHKISGYQMRLWIITAVIAPVVFFSDGSWLGVLTTGFLLCGFCWLALRFGFHWEGRIYRLLQILWLCVLLSQLLPYSASCWPTAKRAFPTVPLVLLALAAMAARGSYKSIAGGIGVLYWVVVILIGIVIIAGCRDLRTEYLVAQNAIPKDIFFLIFLIPAVASFISCSKGGKGVLWLLPILAAGISAWTAGSLSPELAVWVSWPFYEAAKSVQLLDVAKRFEALVSVGVTVGNYGLYCLLLCAIYSLGDRFDKGREAVTICALIAGSIMLAGIKLPINVMVAVSFVLWIFLPLLGVFKNKKNSEKSCN